MILRDQVNLLFLIKDWVKSRGRDTYMYTPLSKLYSKEDMLIKLEQLLLEERARDEQTDEKRRNDVRRSSGKDDKDAGGTPVKDSLSRGIFGRIK